MKYENLYKNSPRSESLKEILKAYLAEPIAFRVNAEKGWRILVAVPNGDEDEVTIGLIPFKEWGFLSSAHLPDLSKYSERWLANSQQEQSMPIVPESYNGELKDFIKSIEENSPQWNRILPPSVMIGCVAPSDTRSDSELKERATYIWNRSTERAKEEESFILKFSSAIKTNETDSFNLGIINPSRSDKSKLN